jgi:hypothetical protein
MKSTKPDALLLLSKWKDESTLLFCFVTLPPLRVGLERVTVESFGERGVSLRSEGKDGKVSFVFPPSSVFVFGDSRLVPSEEKTFDAGLSIFLDEPSVERGDGLLLLERRAA